jgi:hypothetical protein
MPETAMTVANIVLIMTDQQRADLCASEGYPLDTMPFVEGLGREGVRFRRAYTPAPACVPARTSLLTGRFPTAHRVRQNSARDEVRRGPDLLDGVYDCVDRLVLRASDGNPGSKPFTGQGPIRTVYFTILISHIVLSAFVYSIVLVMLGYSIWRYRAKPGDELIVIGIGFVVLMGIGLMLRLTLEAVTNGLHRPHTRPMDFTGKPMKSMLFVEAAGTDSDEALHEWVESAVAFVLSLPPKKPAVMNPARASP